MRAGILRHVVISFPASIGHWASDGVPRYRSDLLAAPNRRPTVGLLNAPKNWLAIASLHGQSKYDPAIELGLVATLCRDSAVSGAFVVTLNLSGRGVFRRRDPGHARRNALIGKNRHKLSKRHDQYEGGEHGTLERELALILRSKSCRRMSLKRTHCGC